MANPIFPFELTKKLWESRKEFLVKMDCFDMLFDLLLTMAAAHISKSYAGQINELLFDMIAFLKANPEIAKEKLKTLKLFRETAGSKLQSNPCQTYEKAYAEVLVELTLLGVNDDEAMSKLRSAYGNITKNIPLCEQPLLSEAVAKKSFVESLDKAEYIKKISIKAQDPYYSNLLGRKSIRIKLASEQAHIKFHDYSNYIYSGNLLSLFLSLIPRTIAASEGR